MDLRSEVEKLQDEVASLTRQLATAAGKTAGELAAQLSARRELLNVRQGQLSAQRASEATRQATDEATRRAKLAQDEVERYKAETAQIEADWAELHRQAESGLADFLAAAGAMKQLLANWQQQQARDGKGSWAIDRGLPGPRLEVSANVRRWSGFISNNGRGRL